MSTLKMFTRFVSVFVLSAGFLVGLNQSAMADYENAFKGVKQVKAIFDVSAGSAKFSNVVFWAIENVYQDKASKSLANPPMAAVVFHGPAVKLLSTDAAHHKDQDAAEVKKFHELLTKMKKDGVKIEVCAYALKVLGVDPATVIPAVDKVGNGFISIVGYQHQGYAVVRIP